MSEKKNYFVKVKRIQEIEVEVDANYLHEAQDRVELIIQDPDFVFDDWLGAGYCGELSVVRHEDR